MTRSKKLILSRKGFDTSTGGIPSWIYEGKTYSIPIPEAGTGVFYDKLQFNEQHSYLKVLRDLGVKCYSEAHLDPDLQRGILENRHPAWQPAFGQHGAALSHLLQSHLSVNEGDIFLFFGWFREIELFKGRFRYIKSAPEIHQIFAWLEIGEIVPIDSSKPIEGLAWHPHIVFAKEYDRGDNAVFLAKKESTWFDGEKGAGHFKFHTDLTLSHLSAKPYKRSVWKLPNAFFKKGMCTLSYHENRKGEALRGLKSHKLLQSVARGQEFITPVSKALTQWVQSLQKHIDHEKT